MRSRDRRVTRGDRYAERYRGKSGMELARVLPLVFVRFVGILDWASSLQSGK